MTKTELQKRLAEKCKLTKDRASQVLNEILSGISEGLQADGQVRIAGFGNFTVKERAARKGRNPRTGEEISIPAKKVVVFSESKNLKERLNS